MAGPGADARYRVAFLVWASMLGGVTLFAAVVWASVSGFFGPAAWVTLVPRTAYKLLVLAFLLMAVGTAVRRSELGPGGDPGAKLQAWQTRVVVASALLEAGALSGLGVCWLVARTHWVLGVWLAAAAAMLLLRPRREELDRLLG